VKIDKEKLDNAMAEKGLFVRDVCRRTGITESTMKGISSGAVSVNNMTVGGNCIGTECDDKGHY